MTVAVGIIWRWLYDERGGFINYVLRSSGLVDQPVKFLQSFDWALPCVILADFWQVLGFYMIILLTGLQSIPQHLYEAARVDGVPAWARFFRITLPLLRPSIFLCIVVGILNSFTSFDLVYVMTNGGPGHATELLITYIYKAGFGQTRFDYAAALTVVQFLLLVVLTVLANRLSGGNAGSLERDRPRPARPPGSPLALAAPRHHDRRVVPDADPVLLGAEDLAHRREHLRLSAAHRAASIRISSTIVDVWYLIPFPRYLLNSVIVTTMAIAGNLLFNALAGYALTKHFPGRRWVVAAAACRAC